MGIAKLLLGHGLKGLAGAIGKVYMWRRWARRRGDIRVTGEYGARVRLMGRLWGDGMELSGQRLGREWVVEGTCSCSLWQGSEVPLQQLEKKTDLRLDFDL